MADVSDDDPTLTVAGALEMRRVVLDSDAPTVTAVALGYARDIDTAGAAGPWRVEYAAVHRAGSHDYYGTTDPPTGERRHLRDAPAWLTRALGDHSPNGAPHLLYGRQS